MNTPENQIAQDSMTNRRKFLRYEMPFDVYININNSLKIGDAFHNISEGGGSFQVPIKFDLYDIVLCNFCGKEDSALRGIEFAIPGSVVWEREISDTVFLYGVMFLFNQCSGTYLESFPNFIRTVADAYNFKICA